MSKRHDIFSVASIKHYCTAEVSKHAAPRYITFRSYVGKCCIWLEVLSLCGPQSLSLSLKCGSRELISLECGPEVDLSLRPLLYRVLLHFLNVSVGQMCLILKPIPHLSAEALLSGVWLYGHAYNLISNFPRLEFYDSYYAFVIWISETLIKHKICAFSIFCLYCNIKLCCGTVFI